MNTFNDTNCYEKNMTNTCFCWMILLTLKENTYFSFLSIPWKEGGLDTNYTEHSFYLKKFGNSIYTNVKTLIDEALSATTPDWQNLPPRIRKPIQVLIYQFFSPHHIFKSLFIYLFILLS